MFVIPIILCAVLLILLVSTLRRGGRFWECLDQIPRPPGYPIIGNLFDFMKTPGTEKKNSFC